MAGKRDFLLLIFIYKSILHGGDHLDTFFPPFILFTTVPLLIFLLALGGGLRGSDLFFAPATGYVAPLKQGTGIAFLPILGGLTKLHGFMESVVGCL